MLLLVPATGNYLAKTEQQSVCKAQTFAACLYKGKLSKRTQLRNFTCPETKGNVHTCSDACCSACAAELGCNSWTVWPHENNAHCFLTSWSKLYGPGKTDCASGFMPAPAPVPPVPPPKDAKNVLLLIVDDMRPQLNAAYGQTFMITPNLDKLATSQGAVVFDRAYVQMAWCSPSRNSFLTSRYPDTLQIWDFGKNFRDTPENPPDNSTSPDMKVVPMPQWFKHNGYISLGGGKVYHPNQPPNNDVPYSWSPGPLPYFNFTDPDCPHSLDNKVGCQ